MLYENADPFRLLEPTGALDTSTADYTALDERVVRVEGSRFEPSGQPTAKLEGAGWPGTRRSRSSGSATRTSWPASTSGSGSCAASWRTASVPPSTWTPHSYELALHGYGADAILGPLEDSAGPPREIGLLFKVRAASQQPATAIARTANPLLLHLPLPGMDASAQLRVRYLTARNRAGPVV